MLGLWWFYAGCVGLKHAIVVFCQSASLSGRSRLWHRACRWSVCSFNIPYANHGAGIFTHKTGWFLGQMLGFISQHHGGYGYQIWLSSEIWSHSAGCQTLQTLGDLKWGECSSAILSFCHSFLAWHAAMAKSKGVTPAIRTWGGQP